MVQATSALIDAVSAGQSQIRAALAALINALCTAEAQRLVLILDDLHRLDYPEVYSLLDGLLERLPEYVALVLGTRVEPPLALARMPAYGELGEFTASDLRFASEDALARARAKHVDLTDIATVEQALQLTPLRRSANATQIISEFSARFVHGGFGIEGVELPRGAEIELERLRILALTEGVIAGETCIET